MACSCWKTLRFGGDIPQPNDGPGPDRIGWQHKAGMTEMLADLCRMVRTLDAY
jgi:hypothetical protein